MQNQLNFLKNPTLILDDCSWMCRMGSAWYSRCAPSRTNQTRWGMTASTLSFCYWSHDFHKFFLSNHHLINHLITCRWLCQTLSTTLVYFLKFLEKFHTKSKRHVFVACDYICRVAYRLNSVIRWVFSKSYHIFWKKRWVFPFFRADN